MKREAVDYIQDQHQVSERRTRNLAGLWRSIKRYRSIRIEPEGFRKQMLELASLRPRFGYPRIHVMLRREGFLVNKKLTYRIYREEDLQVRRKRCKRVSVAPREAKPVPDRPHQSLGHLTPEQYELSLSSGSLLRGFPSERLTTKGPRGTDRLNSQSQTCKVGRPVPRRVQHREATQQPGLRDPRGIRGELCALRLRFAPSPGAQLAWCCGGSDSANQLMNRLT
jgi:hypothetical protein